MKHGIAEDGLCGILPVDKPAAMTSHDIVALVRRALYPSRPKVGHAGTLDPDATGLLLVCIGAGTRLADLVSDRPKCYRARFILGVTTTTEDASGEEVSRCDASAIERAAVRETLDALTGRIEQIPPMVSAVHHNGRRLYELARMGLEVERAARTICVERIDLDEFAEGPEAAGWMTVVCGRGAYIRTLCADLGSRLGVGGHLASLRRLTIGDFTTDGALKPVDFSADSIAAHLVSASDAVSFLPLRRLSRAEESDILHGRSIPGGIYPPTSTQVALVSADGALIALATPDDTGPTLRPSRVLKRIDCAQ